ncbi:hypothetical protein [Aliiruegeria lutimaris]|uniref:Uncharacterized protein n=1 Tax=Aliiruegeria lutimaris TaxID=571298 RepID=A0A1G9G330_9RHOB|nr:hypothetical protein [Aliiruegeria lutimaris]SDK95061.1 hypothetical protein SAMN04488026_10615 [Aliiruegeria lutimaris]
MTGKAKKVLSLSSLLAGTALVWAASGVVSLATPDMNMTAATGPWEVSYGAGLSMTEGPGEFLLAGMSGESAKGGDQGSAGNGGAGEAQSGDDKSSVASDTTGDLDRDRLRLRDGDCDGDQDGDCDRDRDRLRDRDCDGDPDKDCDQDRDRDRDRDGSNDDADES